jgi:hypothetical protein
MFWEGKMPVQSNPGLTYDSDTDITDCWIEETDSENECGEVARAFFIHEEGYSYNNCHEDVRVATPVLIAIRVYNEDESTFYGRQRAIEILGYDTICRIENVHYEEIMEDAE